ncbi:MAG: DNA translocase FtsK [Clostridia bacterium]|nr:DNA translocase FtsK [Clostridia bacterium]
MQAPSAPVSPVNKPAPSAPVAPVNMPAPSVQVAPVNAPAPAAAAAAAVSAAAVSADVLYNAEEVLESSGDVKQIGASQPISDESGKTRNRRRRARAETPAVQATPSMQPASAASDVSMRQTSPAASVEPAVPVHQAAEATPVVSRAQEVRPSPAAGAVNPYTRPAPVDEPETETDYENPDERPFGIDLNRQHPDGELPASIPARGYGVQPQRETERQGQPDRVMQPVQQMAQPKEQTIVQLRENRLDGTPMVPLPRDEHDSKIEVHHEYVKPSYDLLEQSRSNEDPDQRAKDENGMKKLLATLESFGVQARGLTYTHGPAITRYEIQPAPGVKVSRIVNLVDDIALNMASTGVRIEAPIPGKAAVGIEVPNDSISMVTLRDVIDTPEMAKETSPTAVALGKGISGKPVIADMAKMPHVLIAGATGSGKSVCINTIINSIIFRASPDEVRLILVDPKVVELSVYNGIPHLLIPVVTDPKKASAALDWAVVEMEHRYKRFESMGVRDIKGYNAAIGPDEPRMYKIIVIIDELADLMMVAPGEVEESICRLAQLARAAGIHLVIATQRPSVNVITGVIKANIPSRIAFAVSSQIDSRTILDTGGAEKLLGKGDMLYAPQGAGKPTRVQGCFVSDAEVERIVKAVKSQHQAEYSDDVMDRINSATEAEKAQDAQDAPAAQDSQVDEMLAKAIELAVESGQVSISMLQRRLRVGYARAGRLVDEMTLRGITAEAEGPTKPRQVLISREEWKRMQEEM